MKPDGSATVNAFEVQLLNGNREYRNCVGDGWTCHDSEKGLSGLAGKKGRSENVMKQGSEDNSPEQISRSGDHIRYWQRFSSSGRNSLFLILLTVFGAIAFSSMSCSRSSANQYDPGEANILVAAAYGAKDGECGTTHTFNSILFFPADRPNVEACVAAILETSCTDWAVTDPTPTVCKFIGVQFES